MENKYLLLRDNKQSGPYSFQELVEKGIKAYDLVWAEGKSAAWRYPSEIEELKPFSPVVEEQPFDRFYRRNIASEQASTIESGTTSKPVDEEESSFVRRPVEISQSNSSGKRKIFVTMPGGAKLDRRLETQNKNQESANVSGKETPLSKDTSAFQPTDESSNELLRPTDQSLQNADNTTNGKEQRKDAKASGENSYYAAKSIKTIVEEAPDGFSSLFQDKYSLQDEKIINIRPKSEKKSTPKFAVRAILAACLLLGGVVIGLVISYYNQKSSSRDLDALVKQIQDRDKQLTNENQQAAVAPVQTVDTQQVSSVPVTNSDNTSVQGAITPKPPVPGTKKDDKKQTTVPADNGQDKNATPSVAVKEPEQPKVSAEKPANTKSDAAVESARKNIYSLVGIEGTKYKTGVLGGISDLRLTISNNSLFQLDRVEVEIRYFGPEKRVVKTQTLLFNDIAAGQQRTLEAPRSSRGVSVEYSIRFIDSKELGLAHSAF